MKKPNTAKSILKSLYGNHIVLTAESLIVGILTGLAITAFRKSIDAFSLLRRNVYASISFENIFTVLILAATVIIFGLFMGFLIKKYPMIKGSGVSQIKGNFMQKLVLSIWPELPLKFIGGLLSIGTGLSLGREGPSVQIGAYIGSGFEKIGKQSHLEKVCLITSGAAAGLAATFGAPFAGVIFAIEDLHQYLSPLLLTCVISGAVAGDFIASLFFRQGAIFNFKGIQLFPLKYFGYLVLLGMLTAIAGDLFKKAIYTSQKVYGKLNVPQHLRPLIPFLLSVPVCIFLPLAASGGDRLIDALGEGDFSVKMLFILFTIKIIFTGLSAGSGAIGGIFVPLLTCGALTGILFSKFLVTAGLIENGYAINVMIFAMAAFFATVIKAPLTAVVLMTETSGRLYHLGGITLTVLSAYITANLIHSPANDDVLLKQLLDGNNGKEKPPVAEEGKQMFEVFVAPESQLDGKLISQVQWPDDCLIVSLARGEEEIIPDGNTKISAGDRLLVLTDSEKINEYIVLIGKMGEE